MTIKFLSVLVAIFLSVQCLVASSQFYRGTGQAETIEEAKKLATADLAASIQSFVTTSFQQKTTEENLEISSEYIDSQIKTFSSIVLKNVQYNVEEKKTGIIRKKITYNVTAKVAAREIVRIFEERKLTIRTMLKEAVVAENTGNLSKSLKNYFWAYILTYSYPDSIQISLPPYEQSGNARVLLTEKLNDIFKEISAKVERSYSDGDDYILRLALYIRDIPVTNLEFSYYNGTEEDWCDVSGSLTNLTLSGNFGSTHKILRPFVEYEFKDDMNQINDVKQVYDFLDIPEFDNSFKLDIDISQFLKCDFSVATDNHQAYFVATTTHVAVSAILWYFGDGSTSNIKKPVHTYNGDGTYQVKLMVNQKDDLSAVHTVHIGNGSEENNVQIHDNADVSKSVDVQSEMNAEKKVPDLQPHFNMENSTAPLMINDLLGISDFQSFLKTAKLLSSQDKIVFGNARDFENRENLLCFVFDKDSGEKLASYRFHDDSYEDLNMGERFHSLKSKYSSQNVAVVWVEEIE